MNQNIDLTKILKDCPAGTCFWSDNFGVVKFVSVGTERDTPIEVQLADGWRTQYTKEGWCDPRLPASCLLWPSRDCRDWSKFSAPWYKKEKFDPKTLCSFDKVIVRHSDEDWACDFFSHIDIKEIEDFPYITISGCYNHCIPYNDDTKHLIGTTDEAPEYYRYWED